MARQKIEALGYLDYGSAPESDDDVREWLKNRFMMRHFINGELQIPGREEYFKVENPATGEILAYAADGREADVDAAMAAAQKAFPLWNGLTCHRRSRYLYAIARMLAKNSRIFARLESLNNGKTIRETRDADIPLVIRHFYNCAGWAQERDNEFPNHRPGGVVAQVIPWNFPMLMLAWKIAPAIAAGNTVVIKPAEFTPLTAMLFAEMLNDEVGLPPGVVNIVNGGAETGKLIVKHPVPWKVAFTGSTDVGRWIRRELAGSGKHLTLELGGKSPFVIFEDADLDAAVEGTVDSDWFNYGQVCCAGTKLLIQESIYDKFVTKLKNRARKLRGGKPLDKTMDLGALNSPAQLEKVRRLVKAGEDEGAEMWQPEGWTCPADGNHFPPTIFTKVQTSNIVANEEIFGPVIVCLPFRTPKDAEDLSNNTCYGLAASVWTQSMDLALHMSRRIKAGTVWNNCANLFDASAGFGGYRESGYGREGGREGMEEVLVEHFPEKSGIVNETELFPVKDGVDRTYRFLVGGKLDRPDEGQSFRVKNVFGDLIGVVGNANRKDVRNAVVAARKAAPDWEYKATAHLRAQILYFMAENLKANEGKFVRANGPLDAVRKAQRELDAAVERLFHYAALADKFEGTVQPVPGRMAVIAMKEPVGVIGARAPDSQPLLGIVSLIGAAISMGNTLVLVAGSRPLQAAELTQIVQLSDVPPGVVNILTAKDPDARALDLAKHKDVDALWSFASPEACAAVERASVSNLKRTWTVSDPEFDWYGPQGESKRFLREATQVKNIWIPYGV